MSVLGRDKMQRPHLEIDVVSSMNRKTSVIRVFCDSSTWTVPNKISHVFVMFLMQFEWNHILFWVRDFVPEFSTIYPLFSTKSKPPQPGKHGMMGCEIRISNITLVLTAYS
jgi:hypothetical protein